MGLIEKRMLAQLRDETVPKYQSELREITGSDLSYDIDWDTFADNSTAMGNLAIKGLQPLSEIFRKITVDQLGKDAVKQSIQSIHLSQSTQANISAFTLVNGVLTMPWDWQGWAGSFFPDSVREQIESLL